MNLDHYSWDSFELCEFLQVAGVDVQKKISGKEFFSTYEQASDLSLTDKEKIATLLAKIHKI